MGDLRIGGVPNGVHTGSDPLVRDVMDEDDRVDDGARGEQIFEITAHSVGGMISVDEREVDVATLLGEPLQRSGQQLAWVARVEDYVRHLPDQHLRGGETEGMHLFRVRSDASQAATVRRPDLDRKPWFALCEHALHRRPLTKRHLPDGIAEDPHVAPDGLLRRRLDSIRQGSHYCIGTHAPRTPRPQSSLR